MEEFNQYEVRIHLICGEDAQLVHKVLEYATVNNYARVTMCVQPDEVKGHGFVITDSIYKNGEVKAHMLTKKIT